MTFPKFQGGDKPNANKFNDLRDAIQGNELLPGNGVDVRRGPGGQQLAVSDDPPFIVKLSGSSSPYSWTEYYATPTGMVENATRTGSGAYEVNNAAFLNGKFVRLYPGAARDYRFQYDTPCCTGGGGGTGTIGTLPFCYCPAIPSPLTMTSESTTCNFGMFQNCTIVYGQVPPAYASLGLGTDAFISIESFPDVLMDGALFQYLLTCQFNQFVLTRLYPVSPLGSPFRDASLYTWYVGSYGNTCSPFHLDLGAAFPGSDASCFVTLDS